MRGTAPQLDQMALPPCHLLYQFLPNAATRELSLCLYVRSNDIGLGAPFNLCEAALLLSLVARLTGYAPRWLSYFIGDAHIYENQLDMLHEQLRREPYPLPRLAISPIASRRSRKPDDMSRNGSIGSNRPISRWKTTGTTRR